MKGIFEKYYKKLMKIGLLKSAALALIVGFCVDFLVAFAICFIDIGVGFALGVSIGSGAFAAIVSFPIFYFTRFKPTSKRIAAILDKQGLEERVITMVELENDDSFVAMRQRENAIGSLESVSPKCFKFALPFAVAVVLAVTLVLGASMTTVSTLTAADVIFAGDETEEEEDGGDDEDDIENLISILYIAGEHGSIEGKTFQQIPKGGDATTVVAIPDEGYEFVNWSDGVFTAERKDTRVPVSFSATAVFKEKKEVGEGSGAGEGGEDQGGGGDQGGEGQDGGNTGESGQGGNGQGGNGGEGDGGGGASDSDKADNNTVIDGNKDYHDELDYEAMKDRIINDDSLTQEEKDMLLTYLKILMEGAE